MDNNKLTCPYEKKCGGCSYINVPYEEQLKKKKEKIKTERLLSAQTKAHAQEQKQLRMKILSETVKNDSNKKQRK